MPQVRANREQAIMMTSSAGLELFWSLVACGSAGVGVLGTSPIAMSAFAALALALALFARSGTMAARWPTPPRDDTRVVPTSRAISVTSIGALFVLAMGALALVGVGAPTLAGLALLVLAGVVIVDAPLEVALAAPRGRLAGVIMLIGGIGAIVVLGGAFSMRAAQPTLVPWAALLVAIAQVTAASAVLLRCMRRALNA